MKKTTLALTATIALLGAAASAQAQSSVTIYALIDVNGSAYSSGSRANAGSLKVLNDGTVNGLNGSRLGFRGVEDLGGGLKAGFLIEQGVITDTGTLGQGGRGWGRQAFVYLSSSAGEVRLGRQYLLSDSLVGQGNPFSNALTLNPTTSVTNMTRNLPMFLNAPRADNVVQYQTPSLGGLVLAGQVGAGEAAADRFHGVRVHYSNPTLYAGVSYEWNKQRNTGADTNKSLSASANIKFGIVKLLAGIQRNSDLATGSGNGAAAGVSNLVVTGATSFTMTDANGWTVGTEVSVTPVVVLGANYTRMSYERPGASANLGKAAIGVRYALSKNTFLYTSASQATGGLKEYISQKRVLQAGIRTAF